MTDQNLHEVTHLTRQFLELLAAHQPNSSVALDALLSCYLSVLHLSGRLNEGPVALAQLSASITQLQAQQALRTASTPLH